MKRIHNPDGVFVQMVYMKTKKGLQWKLPKDHTFIKYCSDAD